MQQYFAARAGDSMLQGRQYKGEQGSCNNCFHYTALLCEEVETVAAVCMQTISNIPSNTLPNNLADQSVLLTDCQQNQW